MSWDSDVFKGGLYSIDGVCFFVYHVWGFRLGRLSLLGGVHGLQDSGVWKGFFFKVLYVES